MRNILLASLFDNFRLIIFYSLDTNLESLNLKTLSSNFADGLFSDIKQ